MENNTIFFNGKSLKIEYMFNSTDIYFLVEINNIHKNITLRWLSGYIDDIYSLPTTYEVEH